MTKQHEPSAGAKSGAETVREEWEAALPFDPELAHLVRFINALESVELGVTLHVGGSVVSGMLISITQFYRLLTKQLADAGRTQARPEDRDTAAAFVDLFQPPFNAAQKELEEARKSQVPPPSPRHVHLRYAQTYTSPEQTLTMTLWRGRLTEVDGWSVGNFGTIPRLSPQDL